MVTLAQHQRSVSVAGVMEPVFCQSRPAGNPLKCMGKRDGEDRGAISIAEHRAIFVDCVALQKPIHFLALPERYEKQGRRRREGYQATACGRLGILA